MRLLFAVNRGEGSEDHLFGRGRVGKNLCFNRGGRRGGGDRRAESKILMQNRDSIDS